MIKQREKDSFIKSALLLKELQDQPERIKLILELHKIIIRGIIRQEKLIGFDKSGIMRLSFFKRNKRPSRDLSLRIDALCKKLNERIKDRKEIIFIYKCFGDGIAYIYQSMYSIKHLYYNNNYQIKEDSGNISGKRGFLQEWRVFLARIKHNIPVVMSDITNVIRNGDVCDLSGRDPYPIEVKLTKHVNPRARVRRQIININEIISFYENDYAPQFRGGVDAYRVPLSFQQVDYIDDINHLIKSCKNKPYVYKEVEKGVVYFCINTINTNSNIDSYLNEFSSFINRSSSMVISLSPDQSWQTAYPFTLSLSLSGLMKFIYGEVLIFISVDLEILRSNFLREGVYAKFVMDGTSAIYTCKNPNNLIEGAWIVSELYFLRNAISFLSFEVFASECSCHFSMEDSIPKSMIRNMRESYLNSGILIDETMMNKWDEIIDVLERSDNDHSST